MNRGRVSPRALGGALTLQAVALALAASTIMGCSSRLPGPAACEAMAERLIGEEPKVMRESPAKKRFLTIVTHGCLTIPFDHQAVRCVEETRGLPRCMDELAWRVPERKASIAHFMTRALAP